MYRRLRFIIRLVRAFLTKHFIYLLTGLGLSLIALRLFPSLLHLTRLRPANHIGLIGRYSASDLPPAITSKLSVGLTSLDSSGQLQPALAHSWQATDSGRTFIFYLNSHLRWHDGTPVKSQHIKYQLRDVTIEYPTDDQLVIRLSEPFAPLPLAVSHPVFNSASPRPLIGIGTYRLRAIRQISGFVDTVSLEPADQASLLPRLVYHFYPTQSQAKTALKLGIITTLEDIQDTSDLSSWPNLEITARILTSRYLAVFFNTQDSQLSGPEGKNFRLALTYAIDKTRWPPPRRALGPLSSSSWAYLPSNKPYTQDVAKARDLLSKLNPPPVEISLATVPLYLSTAEAIKQDWEKHLGLKVNLRVTPDIPTDFQALLVAQAIPADPDQYNLWHSTQTSTNLTHLNHPRIDKLLEDGRKTLDQTERLKIYQDFQKFLVEEAPAAFLYYPESYTITRK